MTPRTMLMRLLGAVIDLCRPTASPSFPKFIMAVMVAAAADSGTRLLQTAVNPKRFKTLEHDLKCSNPLMPLRASKTSEVSGRSLRRERMNDFPGLVNHMSYDVGGREGMIIQLDAIERVNLTRSAPPSKHLQKLSEPPTGHQCLKRYYEVSS